MFTADSSEENDLAGNTNNETKIIVAVICLLGLVAIGAEVWFHYSKQSAMEKADALRAKITTQVPIWSAETNQAQLLDAEPVGAAMVPAVTTTQSGSQTSNNLVNTSRQGDQELTRKSFAPAQIRNTDISRNASIVPNSRAAKNPGVTRNAKVSQDESKVIQAKTVTDPEPIASPNSSQISEDDSASGLPPVSDRTAVIARAKTGGVNKRGADSDSPSERSVWEQLRRDIKQGGKADLCNDAMRSLNQCP